MLGLAGLFAAGSQVLRLSDMCSTLRTSVFLQIVYFFEIYYMSMVTHILFPTLKSLRQEAASDWKPVWGTV